MVWTVFSGIKNSRDFKRLERLVKRQQLLDHKVQKRGLDLLDQQKKKEFAMLDQRNSADQALKSREMQLREGELAHKKTVAGARFLGWVFDKIQELPDDEADDYDDDDY